MKKCASAGGIKGALSYMFEMIEGFYSSAIRLTESSSSSSSYHLRIRVRSPMWFYLVVFLVVVLNLKFICVSSRVEGHVLEEHSEYTEIVYNIPL